MCPHLNVVLHLPASTNIIFLDANNDLGLGKHPNLKVATDRGQTDHRQSRLLDYF